MQPGPAMIRIWVNPKGKPGASTTLNAQLAGGESRVLRVEYSGGALSGRIQ